MIITRKQINNYLQSDDMKNTYDAEWYISLIKNFLHLLDGEEFNSDDLLDSTYIKKIIKNKKENKYSKIISTLNNPEYYITNVFYGMIQEFKINSNEMQKNDSLKIYVIGTLSREENIKEIAMYYMNKGYFVNFVQKDNNKSYEEKIRNCYKNIRNADLIIAVPHKDNTLGIGTMYEIEYAKTLSKDIKVWNNN